MCCFSAADWKGLPLAEKCTWNLHPSCLLSSCTSGKEHTNLTWTSKKVAKIAEPWGMGSALWVRGTVATGCFWMSSHREKVRGTPGPHVLLMKKTGSSNVPAPQTAGSCSRPPRGSAKKTSCLGRRHPEQHGGEGSWLQLQGDVIATNF